MIKPSAARTVEEYISMIDDPRRTDIRILYDFIKRTVPDLEPFMVSGMIGFGKYHYKYASGREGDWAIIGLASQKNYISVYVCAADKDGYVAEQNKHLFSKANIGRSCIRFKKVGDIDLEALGKVIKEGAKLMREGKFAM